MHNERFFNQQTEQSYVKSILVFKYFKAWAKIMVSQVERNRQGEKKIAYLDLFSGPGYYDDGSPSTPILVLNHALSDMKLRSMLISTFNDMNRDNASDLAGAISELPNITTLKHYPNVRNTEVDDEITSLFETTKTMPSLIFVDPWGYKAISLKLISSAIKNWGCDCIFFFNYNRINMGLSNPLVTTRMKALFGERSDKIGQRLVTSLNPSEREETIVLEFINALSDMECPYVLPFGFKNDQGTRTTHHIIFVTKHELGYKIMKNIMAGMSSGSEQGVASFTYNPVEAHTDVRQLSLFESRGPLDDLEDALLHTFTGRRVTVNQAFKEHHIGKLYIEKNYSDAFRDLEARGKITSTVPLEKRKKQNGKYVMGGIVFIFP